MEVMFFSCIPFFVCLFWCMMLAFDVKFLGCSRQRLHLLAFMFVASMLYFGHLSFFNHLSGVLPLSDTLYVGANLSVYPLYLFFVRSLTQRRSEMHRRWNLLFVPALLAMVGVGVIYWLMSPGDERRFFDIYFYGRSHVGLRSLCLAQAVLHDVCKAVFGLMLIPIGVMGWRLFAQYEQTLQNVYADVEGKSLGLLRQMVFFFFATSVVSFLANVVGRQAFTASPHLLAVPSVVFSLLLFMVGYVSRRQRFTIDDISPDEVPATETVSDPSQVSQLTARIANVMKVEQLYRKPDLHMSDLVQRLGSNRNYVYQAIKSGMNMSFNEYVNRLRVEYAMHVLVHNPDCLLLEVGERAGFASTTSFYRNFKLYSGMTPKEYQQQLHAEKTDD